MPSPGVPCPRTGATGRVRAWPPRVGGTGRGGAGRAPAESRARPRSAAPPGRGTMWQPATERLQVGGPAGLRASGGGGPARLRGGGGTGGASPPYREFAATSPPAGAEGGCAGTRDTHAHAVRGRCPGGIPGVAARRLRRSRRSWCRPRAAAGLGGFSGAASGEGHPWAGPA